MASCLEGPLGALVWGASLPAHELMVGASRWGWSGPVRDSHACTCGCLRGGLPGLPVPAAVVSLCSPRAPCVFAPGDWALALPPA